MKIALISTVASSFYGFRGDLIHALVKKGHHIYAFTSEYTNEDLKLVIEEEGNIVDYNIHKQEGYVAVVSSHNINRKTQEYIQDNSFVEVLAISSSIKLCMVAEGAGDVYPKFGDTMEWDVAAGHALIKAAGGNVIATCGHPMLYGKKEFINSHFIATSKRWIAGAY